MGLGRRELAIVGGTCIGAVGLYYAIRYIRRCIKNYRHPFLPAGEVSELYIYPVKSCRGRQVSWMECGELGGTNGELKDRHFLVINTETKRFITARTHPRIVLVDCDVSEGILTLTTPENTPIKLDIDKIVKEHKVVTATLHNKLRQAGLDCGSEVGTWLAGVLQVEEPLGLLYYERGLFTERSCVTQPNWMISSVPSREDEIAFADLAPYLAFSMESLDELNSRYSPDSGREVTTRHFRPNIVVKGCTAFDEDLWMELKIGEAEFDCYKPCTRCVMTTVDPSTGEKDPDVEPLKMLRGYRLAPEGEMRKLYKQSPIFGVNMGLNKAGTIRVGDPVFARYKDHPF